MSKPVVLVADSNMHPHGLRKLEEQAELILLPPYSPQDDLIRGASGVDAIVARTARITRAVIEASDRLKIVSRHGVGFDNVDIPACNEHGVVVAVSGDAGSEAVSEYAFACLFAVARNIVLAHTHVQQGHWEREKLIGFELLGKTLGIIGLGRIGSRTARHAKGFDMNVIAYDPYLTPGRAQEMGAELVDLEGLLRRADFICLHMPLNDETRHMISRPQFALMKPTAILVNVARGGLIDEEALHEALTSKQIAGAALDVFGQEPLPAGHPLIKLDNLICSPHVAGQTQESLERVSVRAAENVLRVFAGLPPIDIVNPEVLNNRTRVAWKSEG